MRFNEGGRYPALLAAQSDKPPSLAVLLKDLHDITCLERDPRRVLGIVGIDGDTLLALWLRGGLRGIHLRLGSKRLRLDGQWLRRGTVSDSNDDRGLER